MSVQNKKLRFLAIKLSALEAELNISREIIETVSKEVQLMFDKKYFPESRPDGEEDAPSNKEVSEYAESQPNDNEHDTQQTESKPNEIHPPIEKIKDPEVKNLFKKIASKIHPDKLASLEKYERDKKDKLFRRAVSAMEECDLILLADIAMELDIEIPEISKTRLKQTEQKIIAIKKELSMIESTYVWQWFFCEDETAKQEILEKLFGVMYANNPRT